MAEHITRTLSRTSVLGTGSKKKKKEDFLREWPHRILGKITKNNAQDSRCRQWARTPDTNNSKDLNRPGSPVYRDPKIGRGLPEAGEPGAAGELAFHGH